jgi:hypothetical protein
MCALSVTNFCGANGEDNTVDPFGTVNWDTTANDIMVEDGNTVPAFLLGTPAEYTFGLYGDSFSFSVSGIINGIKLEIKKRDTLNVITDYRVGVEKLIGTGGSSNLAEAPAWPVALTYSVYGGPSSLWGQTWTPANVNGAICGMIVAQSNGNVATAEVDAMRMTVYYTPSGTGNLLMMGVGILIAMLLVNILGILPTVMYAICASMFLYLRKNSPRSQTRTVKVRRHADV